MVHGLKVFQTVYHSKEQVPSVILYTEDTLNTLKHKCTSSDKNNLVQGVDGTLNSSDII